MDDWVRASSVNVMLVVLSAAADASATPWPEADSDVWILPSGPDELAQHLTAHPASTVLVLTASREGTAARLAITVAAGAHPATRFALREASASVLGLAAVGRQATRITADPAAALRLVDAQLDRIVSGVWLRRVNNLSDPAPGLWHHLRSMLPTAGGFLVVFGADPRVTTAAVHTPAEATVLVAAADPNPVAQAIGRSDVTRVAAPISTKNAYSSAGAEFVALPPVPVLAPALAGCPICQQGCDGSVCQFCHVVIVGQERAA